MPEGELDCEAQLALALRALSVVRHDLRNLLASVTIMADRMTRTEDTRLAAAAPQLVVGMEQTVALGVRAQELIEVVPGGPRPVRASEALADAAARAELPPLALDGEDAPALCDPDHLARILAELLANAARAAGADGAVAVSAAREAERVTIRVSDDGPGVPAYGQADLLTPFRGLKRRGGSGLGLPIAAALARANGGAVRIERTGEDGTVAAVSLPLA